MASDTLRLARAYVAAGLSVMPIARGTKEPASTLLPRVFDEATGKTRPSWRMFQERLPTDDELVRWFQDSDAGIAIIAGQVSGGLVVLDLESAEIYEHWRDYALMLLDAALIASLPLVATGKGHHVYFRMPAPIGNRKLAIANHQVLAETRGQGGYVLAPPPVHPSGAVYELLNGDLCAIPLLSQDQALAAARRSTGADAGASALGGQSGR